MCADGALIDLDATDFSPVEAVNHLLGAGTQNNTNKPHRLVFVSLLGY